MDQRTDEWFAARVGCVTASRMGDLMATNKSGPAASRANYMAEVLLERLTGEPAERFQSPAMAWGTDQEPHARRAYEFLQDVDVVETGFVLHPDLPRLGASPDGLVGDDGLVEFKCPTTATHVATLLGAPIDRRYLLQMQTQMLCTGRAWCDFVSFDPRLPAELQTWVRRIERDDRLCADIEAAVELFLAELEAMLMRLASTYNVRAAIPTVIAMPPGFEGALA
jgi:putative phage-type endonuclease